MTKSTFGFGFDPNETQTHFLVVVPKQGNSRCYVEIYERSHWNDNCEQILDDSDVLKVTFPLEKWNAIVSAVTNEFNRQLKEEKTPTGKFRAGPLGTPVSRLMGKELMILIWALENCDISRIPTAISNWLGLQPAERWWLYTTTNASTGSINDSERGWRVALRYALCDNPVRL